MEEKTLRNIGTHTDTYTDVPSIDRVVSRREAKRMRARKCACGSKKKAKNCCLRTCYCGSGIDYAKCHGGKDDKNTALQEAA